MKAAMLVALAGAGLMIVAAGGPDCSREAFAQRLASQAAPGSDGGLIALPGPIEPDGQLITVIDPRARVMSVYHIDKASGKIALRSVRNIHWDLQMTHLDNEGLLPEEIRAMLQQR
ncbi:MAG: hypothetical protein HQ567_18320 [Candidatus Nealsonbacteria bacterium]|nr:hypothetical protein [Candidatus Nealsonbacteria bacterium]